ncbi:transposase [Streptomyces sp. NPDC093984]|uniref:transposase n=1 Tax=Streptomyces sp. NPDC093984 TaxID=3366052 RepID=UPI0038094A69
MNSGSRPPRCCRRSLLVRKVVGPAPCDERAVFTAVVYALTSGCAWRHLPPTFGTSPATAHRRFTVWTEAGLWRQLHRAMLDELGARGEVDWTSAIVDAASVRAKRGDR